MADKRLWINQTRPVSVPGVPPFHTPTKKAFQGKWETLIDQKQENIFVNKETSMYVTVYVGIYLKWWRIQGLFASLTRMHVDIYLNIFNLAFDNEISKFVMRS